MNPVMVHRYCGNCRHWQQTNEDTGEGHCTALANIKRDVCDKPFNAVCFEANEPQVLAETSRTRESGVGLWRVNLPEAEYMIAAYSLEQAQAVQAANALVGDQVALSECEDLDEVETLGPDDSYRQLTFRQMIQETAARYEDQAFPRVLVAAEV